MIFHPLQYGCFKTIQLQGKTLSRMERNTFFHSESKTLIEIIGASLYMVRNHRVISTFYEKIPISYRNFEEKSYYDLTYANFQP